MKKKLLAILLTTVFISGLVGCKNNGGKDKPVITWCLPASMTQIKEEAQHKVEEEANKIIAESGIDATLELKMIDNASYSEKMRLMSTSGEKYDLAVTSSWLNPIDDNVSRGEALQEISDYTDKEIWVETHNEFSSGRVLKKLMEDTDRENVKIIWDIIHPVEEFETPEETWEYIGKKVAHVHVKDGKRSENPFKHEYDYTALGEGALPIKEILCILKKNNYDGYISLEWENAWRPELRKYSMDINDILSGFIEFVNQCV